MNRLTRRMAAGPSLPNWWRMSLMAFMSGPPRPALARIDGEHRKVDREIHEDEEDGEDQQARLEHLVVAEAHGIDEVRGEARPGEDRLDHDRGLDHEGEVQ